MAKTIIINNKATIEGNGTHTNGNSKPVICLDTGEVFTSSLDAANSVGSSTSNMSAACTGQIKTCKGKRFCYLEDVDEHLDALTARIRYLAEMEAKAKAYDAWQAEQEVARKAAEKHQQAIAKATEKVARRRARFERLQAELREAEAKMLSAEDELNALNGNVAA